MNQTAAAFASVLCLAGAACSGDKTNNPAPAPSPTPVVISLAGTVSATGGARVQTATVRFHDGPNAGRSTTTNASGEYTFENLLAGNANVVASTFIHGEVVTGITLNGAQRLDFTLPTPACQLNNTGWVRFGNRSATASHDIIWDGIRIFTVAPGQDSPEISVTAGVTHTLSSRVANSSRLACSTANPIIAQCDRRILTCTGP